MTLNQPINQNSVVEEVISRITDSLIKGELKAGDRIPSEMELCHSFGVGRNSLREALKMFTALGILQVKRGEGTYVADSITPSVFDPLLYGLILQRGTSYELLELRLLFEVISTEIAVSKANDEDIARCEAMVAKYEDFANNKRTTIEELMELDLEFHYTVLDACHNELIKRIGHTVFRLFMGTIIKSISAAPKSTISNHQEIIEIIKKHDRNNVRAVIERSLENWRKILES